MIVTSKSFTCYPGQQQNRIGLSEILKFNLSPFWIDGRTFFVKSLLIVSLFLFKSFYKIRRFFTNVILLNNYLYYPIFLFQLLPGMGVFFIGNTSQFFFLTLIK